MRIFTRRHAFNSIGGFIIILSFRVEWIKKDKKYIYYYLVMCIKKTARYIRLMKSQIPRAWHLYGELWVMVAAISAPFAPQCVYSGCLYLCGAKGFKGLKKKRLAIHVVIISNLFMSATRHCLAYTHEYYLYSMRICVMCLCSTLALWFAIVAHSLLIYMSGVPVCMRHGDTNTSSMTITRQHAGCTAHLRVPFLASLCRCSSRNLPHSNTILYL